MGDSMIMESSFSATINAPIEDIDIPSWCFTLPDAEYQACSPAHCAAGSTTTPDGRRMSINVEVIGGTTLVQHYVEEVGEPDHLRLVSTSDWVGGEYLYGRRELRNGVHGSDSRAQLAMLQHLTDT
jgi:hypothetical protein